MHKTIYLILFFATISVSINGQETETSKTTFFDNVRFGGGINMGLGQSHSYFSIAPSAIYDISEQFSAGVGFTYMYYKRKSTTQPTTNIYGGSILTLFRPIKGIQLSAEFERIKLSKKQIFQEAISPWQEALFIGAEYVTGNISMGLRYDVLYEKNLISVSPLSPVFRIYF